MQSGHKLFIGDFVSKGKIVVIGLNMPRILIAYYLATHGRFSDRFIMDNSVWTAKNLSRELNPGILTFGYNMVFCKEFRNVVLHRLHRNPIKYVVGRALFRPLDSLYINTSPENIGGGLYFQHGFSTIVAARSIGENCHINQQVTVGYVGHDAPVLGNSVVISAGSIVIGNVTVGDSAVVGAGAVVTKDVAPMQVVGGVPARPLRYRMR